MFWFMKIIFETPQNVFLKLTNKDKSKRDLNIVYKLYSSNSMLNNQELHRL